MKKWRSKARWRKRTHLQMRMGRSRVKQLGRDVKVDGDDADAASNPGPWLWVLCVYITVSCLGK